VVLLAAEVLRVVFPSVAPAALAGDIDVVGDAEESGAQAVCIGACGGEPAPKCGALQTGRGDE
jgi:hypothetical protein